MSGNYQDSTFLDLEKALADESVDPIHLPSLFLKAITQGFSDDQRIGSGGFGSVYKGMLRNGMVVAVKKLHNNIVVQQENFQREADCLIKVKHKNIIPFLGYSYETQHIPKQYQGRSVWADEPHMLFCFEFLSKGSLAKYLAGGVSSGLQWRVRYQIIKGICEGLGYLHQQRIIHMDLKPDNILLDDSMVPKIADFGLSRRFTENQSKSITENIIGSRGYMAPEFLKCGAITFKTDIYSLGVIIIEILIGCKECPNVDKVLESWANTFGTLKSNPLLEQVKLCAEIGIHCMDDDPSKRPDIQDILHRLNETDISVQLGRFYQYYRQAKQACKPMRITAPVAPELAPCWLSESALLDVHPLELCFPFEAKKVTECSLNLINKSDRYFAYFIRTQFQDMYAIDQHISYDLLPMSTVVLTVKMIEQELPPLDAGMFEILMVSLESKKDLQNLESSIGNYSQKNDDDLLKRVEELDGEVHVAVLKAVICPPKHPAPKVISRCFQRLQTIDVHSTQPWILAGHGTLLSIWKYGMEAVVDSLDINSNANKLYRMIHGRAHVTSARFIPRMQWCVAGDDQGYIHVCTCLPLVQIKSFKALSCGRGFVHSLAIHPTYPYLLSLSNHGDDMLYDDTIEIFDWEKGWACVRKVETGKSVCRATFNPVDANSVVTSDYDNKIKVWSINSSAHQPITEIEINCDTSSFQYLVFTEAAGRNHVVVSRSFDAGLQIWDLQTGTRVHTLDLHSRSFTHISAIAYHPKVPLIAVGGFFVDFFNDGEQQPGVCFCNSTNYRVEKTVRCKSSGGRIKCLGFVGLRRLVIGYMNEIEILEIDMESLACQQ